MLKQVIFKSIAVDTVSTPGVEHKAAHLIQAFWTALHVTASLGMTVGLDLTSVRRINYQRVTGGQPPQRCAFPLPIHPSRDNTSLFHDP
jgi:hypothetical protein